MSLVVGDMQRLNVVVCGGGFAAAEGLLRLHRLTGERVAVTLITPNEHLNYRPRTVMTPFTGSPVARYPIRDLAAATSARWVRDRLASVDLRSRTLYTANGQSLNYDAALLALGAQERKPNPHVALFTDRTGGQTYRGIVEQIDTGAITSLTLIEPSGPSWPVPLYELALLTAKHAHDRGLRVEITLVTPRPHPLYPFGETVGATVERLLQAAGVTLHSGTSAHIAGPRLVHLTPAGVELRPDRIVTLPTITGPNVRGVPGDARDRFIPVDDRCRVPNTDGRVFAAGDATDLRVKHGGLATQQADIAAAGIAHLADVAPAPGPFRPVLYGTLLTGDAPLYLQAHLVAGRGWQSQILTEPAWPADQLVVADELVSYLAEHPPAG
ncbi:MAG: FAD-dependent oxidoreductase [Mycobacterium sp.]